MCILRCWGWVTDISTLDTSLRRHISEPYNFQHLTHTQANQFPTLQKTSHSELVSEFSAIRASQIPCRDLQGIKAESLQPSTVPPDVKSESPSPVRSHHASSPPPSPLSPPRPEARRFGSQASIGSNPYPRAAETCSQAGPKSYKPRPSPITPPPRISSKYPGLECSSGNREPPRSPLVNSHLASTGFSAVDVSTLTNISTPLTTLEWENDVFDYSTTPHAVSTPDGTALTLKPLPFGNVEKDLPGLPEEAAAEKVNAAKSHSPSPSSSSSPLPSSSTSSTIRPSPPRPKSFPSAKSSSRRWSRTSPRVSPDGLISPLMDGPPLAEAVIPSMDHHLDDIPFRPRLSRRISNGTAKFDECWEEEIDYCYEHAAEADCDFDWNRVLSRNGEKNVSNNTDLDIEPKSSHDVLYKYHNNAGTRSSDSEPSNGQRSPFYLPLLQPSSMESNSSSRDSSKSSTLSINGPATPSQSLVSPITLNIPFKDTKDYSTSPLFISRDFESQLIQDDVYQRLLAGENVSEQIYSFHDGSYETSSSKGNSPRSSHSHISKNGSQESFTLGRSASICHHHDEESVGSLPELVYSRWNRQSNDLLGVCAPRSQPEKPLPRRPIPGENLKQGKSHQSMIQSSMRWNPSRNDPDDQIEVVLPPQVPPKALGERLPSRTAVRNIDEFTSPHGLGTPSRRFGSSKVVSTQAMQASNQDQSAPGVLLSVPF